MGSDSQSACDPDSARAIQPDDRRFGFVDHAVNDQVAAFVRLREFQLDEIAWRRHQQGWGSGQSGAFRQRQHAVAPRVGGDVVSVSPVDVVDVHVAVDGMGRKPGEQPAGIAVGAGGWRGDAHETVR